jgi:hydrogenase maturation protease
MSDESCLSRLISFLAEAEGKHILFAGLGNLLRKDDGVGAYITRNIIKRDHITPLTVEVSLENYIGKINTLNPEIVVFIDCTEMRQDPGYYILLSPEKIADHTFNTHNISLSRLNSFFDMPAFLLALQPEDTSFGEVMTPLVQMNADEIIKTINRGKEGFQMFSPDDYSQIGNNGIKMTRFLTSKEFNRTDF